MPYCPRCGVEVEVQAPECPLCATPIPNLPDLPTAGSPSWPQGQNPGGPARYFSTPQEIRSRILLIMASLLLVAGLTVLAVDFYTSGSFSWSWIPAVCLLAAFVYLATGFSLYHTFLPLTTIYLVVTAGFLFVLDFLTEGKSWFLPLGLPILLSLFLVLGVSYLFILNIQHKGFNVFGIILLGVTLFTTSVDVMIQLFLTDTFHITWSFLTTLILFPTALNFFWLHYGLKKRINLHRTFHI